MFYTLCPAIITISGELHGDLRVTPQPFRLLIKRRLRIAGKLIAIEREINPVPDIGDEISFAAGRHARFLCDGAIAIGGTGIAWLTGARGQRKRDNRYSLRV